MIRAATAAVLTLLTAILSGASVAAANGIEIVRPWARATPGGVTVGAAYLEIVAGKDTADRLTGVASPAAERVEFHNHVDDQGVMKMRRLEAVDVPAGQAVMFAPGGLHLMLLGLRGPLVEKGTLPLTLTFEKAGPITAEATIGPVGAMGPEGSAPGAKPAHDDPGAGSHEGSHDGASSGSDAGGGN